MCINSVYKGAVLKNLQRDKKTKKIGDDARRFEEETEDFPKRSVCRVPGANVPISSKDAAPVDRKPKKETALQRHRKWLVELQSTKLELEKQYASDAQAKEDRATRFMEREAKLRKVVKDVKYGATASSGGGGADDAAQSKRSAADDDADEGGGAVSQAKGCFKGGAATVVDGATAAALGRPMWAMTEDQALEAADQRDDDDCDELLDFAQGLDFDKYINDSEVSALITNVRARIAELETEATHEAKTESHLSDRAIDREIEAQARTPESLCFSCLRVMCEREAPVLSCFLSFSLFSNKQTKKWRSTSRPVLLENHHGENKKASIVKRETTTRLHTSPQNNTRRCFSPHRSARSS